MYFPRMYFPDMFSTETIANKLNYMMQDPDVRSTVEALVGARVDTPSRVLEHPHVCVEIHPDGLRGTLGFLGLFNGVLRLCDQPVLLAHFDANTRTLLYFSAKVVRTPDPEPPAVN